MPTKKTASKKVEKLQPATPEEIEEMETDDSDMFEEEEEEEEDEEEGNYIEQSLARKEQEQIRKKKEQLRAEQKRKAQEEKLAASKKKALSAVRGAHVQEREPEREIKDAKTKRKPVREQTQSARKTDGHYYRSWNDVRFEGYVKREPEMIYTDSGTAITKFDLQVNQGKGRMPMFLQVTCWDDLAESVAENILPNERVRVLGSMNQYKSQQGKYYTGVTADVVEAISEWEN